MRDLGKGAQRIPILIHRRRHLPLEGCEKADLPVERHLCALLAVPSGLAVEVVTHD